MQRGALFVSCQISSHSILRNQSTDKSIAVQDSTNDATLRSQSKKRKKNRLSLDSNKSALTGFNVEQLKDLEASFSENGGQPNEDEVNRLAIQTGHTRETIEVTIPYFFSVLLIEDSDTCIVMVRSQGR